MKVKIFTEGGSDIGLGHISRCSSLYDEVSRRGIDVEFIVYGNIENIDFLSDKTVKNVDWLSQDYLQNCINNLDHCIVDSYLASDKLYQIISNKAKNALFIDDNARIKYPKGIVVNPSLTVSGLNYSLSHKNTYLLGAKYIILRDPFINVQRNRIHKEVKEVFVTMGGSDIRNLTPKIINGICSKYPQIQFSVVIGNAFSNIEAIKNMKFSNVKFYYKVDAELIKTLMLRSDLAITAMGQTIYELLATQTPFIPIKVIDNQDNNIKGLRQINPNQLIINYDDKSLLDKLDKEFNKMLSQAQRERFINTYKNQIDGLGSKRIIDSFLKE